MIAPDLQRRIRPVEHRTGGRDRARVRRARIRAWWPTAFAAALGLLLLLQYWHWITMDNALEVLVRITFVTAVSAVIIGDFMRFLTWWFFTRRQP